jgi:hypothetical protein
MIGSWFADQAFQRIADVIREGSRRRPRGAVAVRSRRPQRPQAALANRGVMRSRLAHGAGHLGWTAVYVSLVVAPASAVFSTGAPTHGCYPGCVGTIEPTLAIAGLAALLAGVVLAAVARLLASGD